MYEDQNNFLKKINAHRKTNIDKNMVVSNIKMADFSNFYRKLFTHVERPNSLRQDEIERNVKAHYESIEKHTINKNLFLIGDIENVVKILKNKVA